MLFTWNPNVSLTPCLVATQTDNVKFEEIVEELGRDFAMHLSRGSQDYSVKFDSSLQTIQLLMNSLKQHETKRQSAAALHEGLLSDVSKKDDELLALEEVLVALQKVAKSSHDPELPKPPPSEKEVQAAASVARARETLESARSRYNAALTQVDDIDEAIASIRKQLCTRCIIARNHFVSESLKHIYRDDLGSCLSSPSAAHTVQHLAVHCISSVEYVKIMVEGEGCPEVSSTFTNGNATGMPRLRDQIWKLSRTSPSVREDAERAIQESFANMKNAEEHSEVDDDGGDTAAASEARANAETAATDKLNAFLQDILEPDGANEGNVEGVQLSERQLAEQMEQALQDRQAEITWQRTQALGDADVSLQDRSKFLRDIIAYNDRASNALLKFIDKISLSKDLASKERYKIWRMQAVELLEEKLRKSEEAKELARRTRAALQSGAAAPSSTGSNASVVNTAMIAFLGDSGAGKVTSYLDRTRHMPSQCSDVGTFFLPPPFGVFRVLA